MKNFFTTLTSQSQFLHDFSALVMKNNVQDWCVGRLFTPCDFSKNVT